MQKKVLIIFIISLGVCAAIGVLTVAGIMPRPWDEMVMGTAALVAAASLLTLCNYAVWLRRSWHPLGVIGAASTVIALGTLLLLIWADKIFGRMRGPIARPWWMSEDAWKVPALAWVVAVATTQIGLLSLARLHKKLSWVRRLTVAFIIVLALFISIPIFDDWILSGDTMFRGTAMLVILVLFGSLSIPILHRLSVINPVRFAERVSGQLEMKCPRCECAQTIPIGRSVCSKCKLRFHVEIEENYCEKCGYLLYRLESDSCPECGTPVSPVQQMA